MNLQLLVLLLFLSLTAWAGDIRIGIIGCDTSHVIAFTELLNNPAAKEHVPGGKVVAAFRGGSPDIPSSASRLDGYVKQLREKYGVEFYESIEELCRQVDAVMLESVDGRPHLEQAKPVILARKPLFIDKPMAGSLRDVVELFRLAKEHKTPVFSASALRFGRNTQAVRQGAIGVVTNALTTSPCELEPHHPELFWYGIHGVESLFTVMGTGCENVTRMTSPEGKIKVIGHWRGGRIGIYQEDKSYGGEAKGEKGIKNIGSFDGYAPLVREIMQFFKTGVSPVDDAETIEIFAFMAAAEESKRSDGKAMGIKDFLEQAGNGR